MAGPNRLTGLISGMDTESLISSLVEARKKKVTTVKKDQMSLKYKQDAWTELNKKLKSFQSTVNNMRFESSYSKKTTTVSDSSVASVITADDAMLANQTLKVNKLATSAYLTGDKLSTSTGTKATAATKLTDLGAKAGDKISISANGKTEEIEITSDMKISDLTSKLSKVGVNAKFDSASQRLFVGASTSGAKADFTISSADGSESSLHALGLDYESNPNSIKIDGQNAEIELNGATFSSSTNNFEINGLNITVNKQTTGEGVQLSTKNDNSAMYDMVKKLITEYTALINEMDKLYNTKNDKNYKPLTDEEKAEMSEYEIEKWEQQLKDQALSKDSTISSISGKLNEVFAKGFTIGNKTMYLHDFGIEPQSYLSAADNEKHALHIKGDKDDSTFSSDENKLEAMISSDPDSVTKFFSQLSKALYESMDEMSSRVKDIRTYGSFFDDIKYKSDYTDYTSRITGLEDKLNAYEDKWYSKFSKMETAMAKLQSKASALGNTFGG